uniref:Non-SMC condensin II complex, subunit D3 n=1 Tax=Sander lucioperca TaxID=283035 RepID=A0A8D0AD48_SANLU
MANSSGWCPNVDTVTWVDAVWDLEFTERTPLDEIIAEELAGSGDQAFRTLYQCLLDHASVYHVALQSIWAILGENEVSIEGLVAVLSFFVLAGKAKAANVQQRVSGLHAASLYLLLLGIPGSIANKVFHEVFLDTCSDLTSHCWPQDCGKKRKKDGLKSSQAEGKRSKPQRPDTPEMEVDEDEEEEEPLHFSGHDLTKIRDAVVLLVQSLLRLLQTFSLKDRPQSASNCTRVTNDAIITPTPYHISVLMCGQLTCCFFPLQIFSKLLYFEPVIGEITFAMVEKSEFRSHGAQAVGMLTSQMASTDYACFIKWLFNYSRHSKMVCRLFSVDVVMVLLEQPERRLEECQDPELTCFLPHKFLIQSLLFARRMDDSPTVQGHALACLAQCLELPSFNVTRAVHNLFSASEKMHTMEFLPFRTVEISAADGSDCDGETNQPQDVLLYIFDAAKENLALLLRRVKDVKTNVRKSALQALVGLLKHNVIPMSWENLATLSERCRDPAVSVKKKALQCLGELLTAKPECSVVQKAWLQGVVPAVVDSENSVQDKALEALDQVLLSQVKPYASRYLDASQRLTWDLLGLLCHDCQHLGRYFSRAFTIWSKQNKFTQTFITNLISHTEADHAAGAWLLLSKVVASSPRLPYGKILDAWDSMDVNVTTCCHILCVMGDIAAHLNEDTKDRIVNDLMSWLKTFTLSLEVICAAVETLCQYGRSENIKETQAFLNHHCGELVSVCEAYLAGIILSENGAQNFNEELMVKHLHTLGVASLNCPAKVGKRTVLLVESVLTTHSDKLQSSLNISSPLASGLGKLCLQHEDLVQKYLPVFARELEVGTEVAVRNNVVVIMCDLCVRYTNIVDHYIPNISACLRDNEAVIREQTLIMLTNLLQEEFVKWKGSLFFRFMVALVDPVPAIASLCEYCLVHLLLKKNSEMFSQHFIECIFHFNSYNKHKSYNKFPQSEREKAQFSLKGAQHREKRFRIYRFLLEHFTDTQRFNISLKINQTVLACFADKELPLDADGAEILSETFNILSLKEMKLQAISTPAGGASGEEPEEENMATMAKVVLQAAQKKVVSQVQKKAFIENTVPLIISLKSLLEQKRSPVLRELMSYLQVTMQDYRNKVKDFFPGDEQLAVEVEFALKMADKEKEMEKQMDNCSLTGEAMAPTAQVSSHYIQNVVGQCIGALHSQDSKVEMVILLFPQCSVQGSPIRSRPLLPFNFVSIPAAGRYEGFTAGFCCPLIDDY